MAYRRQTSKLCVRLTTQESDAINEQLRNYQPGVSDKLKHTVYMMVLAQNQFVEEYKQANNIRDFDYQDPNVEVLLELCDFEIERYDRFRQFRDNSIVYEDNTNDFLRNSYSKDELLYSIQKYIDGGRTKSRTDYKLYLKSIQKNPERVQFFKDKGLSDDEAFCCALTLSYYTGGIQSASSSGTKTSESINRGTSLVIRSHNDLVIDGESGANGEFNDFFPIMHYMVKSLSYIPYYWGTCLRAVILDEEELKLYEVGSVITWLQFSSSAKGDDPVNYFQSRNTYFHIYSLTGRAISFLSNLPKENEILFLPYSTFLILKKEYSRLDQKTHIYIRQVELGISKNSLLWVDDMIMKEEWQNKRIMEQGCSLGLSKNVHIIPKISTHLALSYLDSGFGQQILRSNRNFRILSDMTRPDEENGGEAGAILMKELKRRGFEHSMMLFVFNEKNAKNAVKKHLGENVKGITITTDEDAAKAFIIGKN